MLKLHSINTMSFSEVLHVMQMLKLTAQTASFGRAQHWKVGMGMGSEIRMKSTRVAQGPWLRSRTSPPLPCFCFLGTGLQLTTRLTSSIGDGMDSSCQIGRGGSPSNTLGTHDTETGSPELSAAWRVLAAQGPMGQERHWAEVEMR